MKRTQRTRVAYIRLECGDDYWVTSIAKEILGSRAKNTARSLDIASNLPRTSKTTGVVRHVAAVVPVGSRIAPFRERAPRQIGTELTGGAQAEKIFLFSERELRHIGDEDLLWQRGRRAHFIITAGAGLSAP